MKTNIDYNRMACKSCQKQTTCLPGKILSSFFECTSASQLKNDLTQAFMLALSSPDFDNYTPGQRTALANSFIRIADLTDKLESFFNTSELLKKNQVVKNNCSTS